MKTIWKFDVPIQDNFSLLMPKDSEILKLDLQDGEPKIWALVDSEASQEERHFIGTGTGHPIEINYHRLQYIGTVIMYKDRFVYHVFEMKE